MNKLERLSRPVAGGRTSNRVPRHIPRRIASSREILIRLNGVPDSKAGLAAERPDRIRVVSKNSKRMHVYVDIRLAKESLVLGVEAVSTTDNRIYYVKKLATVSTFFILSCLFISITGVRQSMITEWSRRHAGGGNIHLIQELNESGLRPNADGFVPSKAPVRPFGLVLSEPLLISQFLGLLTITIAISTAIVRAIPTKLIWRVAEICGVPTELELNERAERFETAVMNAITSI